MAHLGWGDLSLVIGYRAQKPSRAGTFRSRCIRSDAYVHVGLVKVRDDTYGCPRGRRRTNQGAVNLQALLAKREELSAGGRQLTWRNSRYNLGRVERNFNEPTLALLHPRRGKRTPRHGVSSIVNASSWTTTSRWQRWPSRRRKRRRWWRRRAKGAVPRRESSCSTLATGTVRRTVFQLTRPGIDAKLVTSYAKDDKLNLWLPSVFTERYEAAASCRRGHSATEQRSPRVARGRRVA